MDHVSTYSLARRKIVAAKPLRGRIACRKTSPLEKAACAALSELDPRHDPLTPRPPLPDPIVHQHEARNVLREELDSDRSPDRIDAQQPQIIVEISQPG